MNIFELARKKLGDDVELKILSYDDRYHKGYTKPNKDNKRPKRAS